MLCQFSRRARKKSLGNHRPVRLMSVPGKLVEKIILGATEAHHSAITESHNCLGWKRPQWSRQHGFMSRRSRLTNWIPFYEKVTHPLDQGKPSDVIFLDFSEGFDTVSRSLLQDKMSSIQPVTARQKHPNMGAVMGRALSVTVNRATPGWWPVSSGVPLRSIS